MELSQAAEQKNGEVVAGMKTYPHCRVRSACFSIQRNLKRLRTYYDVTDVPMPNTDTILEAMNLDQQTKLRGS